MIMMERGVHNLPELVMKPRRPGLLAEARSLATAHVMSCALTARPPPKARCLVPTPVDSRIVITKGFSKACLFFLFLLLQSIR